MVGLCLNTCDLLLGCGISLDKSVFIAVFNYPAVLPFAGELGVCAFISFVKLKINGESREVLIAAIRAEGSFIWSAPLWSVFFVVNVKLRWVNLAVILVRGVAYHYSFKTCLLRTKSLII